MSNTRTPSAAIAPADLLTLLFLGAVWGGAFLFFRIAGPEVGAVWAAEIRVAIAAIVLLAVVGPATVRAARGRIRQFFFVGLTSAAIPFGLIAFAALTLPTALGSLLNATTPLFTALVAAAWLGTAVPPRVIAGLGVGMASVLVLVGWSPVDSGVDTIVAAAASLGAALSYAVGGTYVRRSMADVRPLELAAGQMVASALILLPIALLTGGIPSIPSPGAAASLLALGTVSTAVAWPAFFRLLGRTSPTVASTVTFIVPGFGIVWGAVILAEPIGIATVVGFGLVLVSLVLVAGLRLSQPAWIGRVGYEVRGRARLLPSEA